MLNPTVHQGFQLHTALSGSVALRTTCIQQEDKLRAVSHRILWYIYKRGQVIPSQVFMSHTVSHVDSLVRMSHAFESSQVIQK